MKTYKSLAILLSVFALASCDKNAVQDITGSLPTSRVKFFNFGVGAPAVNFYAGDTKLTAISSTNGTESTNGVSYGSVGNGGYYSGIDAGQYDLRGRIAATVDKDTPISTVSTTLAAGKAYSFYMSGFYNTTTKTVEGFVVEDDFENSTDYTQAYVRFVNAISNSNPMTLYALNTTTSTEVAIGGAVAYKSGGAFVAVPNGVYNLSTRYAGSSTNAIARTGVNFSAGKVYTIGARGDITITSTTATNRPYLDNTANR